MGKLRQQVRHPALPGTSRAKAGAATALSAGDARRTAKLERIRRRRGKPAHRQPG
jgi:hypothetical protein